MLAQHEGLWKQCVAALHPAQQPMSRNGDLGVRRCCSLPKIDVPDALGTRAGRFEDASAGPGCGCSSAEVEALGAALARSAAALARLLLPTSAPLPHAVQSAQSRGRYTLPLANLTAQQVPHASRVSAVTLPCALC